MTTNNSTPAEIPPKHVPPNLVHDPMNLIESVIISTFVQIAYDTPNSSTRLTTAE